MTRVETLYEEYCNLSNKSVDEKIDGTQAFDNHCASIFSYQQKIANAKSICANDNRIKLKIVKHLLNDFYYSHAFLSETEKLVQKIVNDIVN